MSARATGTFEVTLNAEPPYDTAEGAALGRATSEWTFHGDLEASSTVEMLTVRSAVKDSRAYVAIARVTGALGGRKGTFVLQLSATVARGGPPSMAVTLVPDTATGELVGLTGTMTLDVAEGVHGYTFEYTLGS